MKLNATAQRQIKKINKESSISCAEALSIMVNKHVSVNFPRATLKSKNDFLKLKDDIMASHMHIIGDLKGNMVFMTGKKEGLNLTEALLWKKSGELSDVNDDVVSAFNETVNIIGGAYLSALANSLDLEVFPNPPNFLFGTSKDMRSKIIDNIHFKITEVLIVRTDLKIDDMKFKGNMYVSLDSKSLDAVSKIFNG